MGGTLLIGGVPSEEIVGPSYSLCSASIHWPFVLMPTPYEVQPYSTLNREWLLRHIQSCIWNLQNCERDKSILSFFQVIHWNNTKLRLLCHSNRIAIIYCAKSLVLSEPFQMYIKPKSTFLLKYPRNKVENFPTGSPCYVCCLGISKYSVSFISHTLVIKF